MKGVLWGLAILVAAAAVGLWLMLRTPTPAAPEPASDARAATPVVSNVPSLSDASQRPAPVLTEPDAAVAIVRDYRTNLPPTELPPGPPGPDAAPKGPELEPKSTAAFHAEARTLVMPCAAGATHGERGKRPKFRLTTVGDIQGGKMTITDVQVDPGDTGLDAEKLDSCVRSAMVGKAFSAGTTADVAGYEVQLSYVAK